MSGLDRIDRSIIQALNQDARVSSAEIARQLGIPERTVHHRIRKLVEGNFIKTVAVVNYKAFGFDLAVDIFCEVEVGLMNKAAEALLQMPEISYLAISTGDQDISVQAFFKNIEEMQEFITHKLPQVPGLRRTRTVLVPRIIKDTYMWIPPEEIFEPPNGKRAGEVQRQGEQQYRAGSDGSGGKL